MAWSAVRTSGQGGATSFAGLPAVLPDDLVERFRAMACEITFRVVAPDVERPGVRRGSAQGVRGRRTRLYALRPPQPTDAANAEPEVWHDVPEVLCRAIREAAVAHEETGGLFDPRVLKTLESWGYDRSLPFASGEVVTARTTSGDSAFPREPWRPGVRDAAVLLGSEPIDLGGIGKGLAVRWAARELASAGTAALVEAGGDCSLLGAGPEGTAGGSASRTLWAAHEPVAVLSSDRPVGRDVLDPAAPMARGWAGGPPHRGPEDWPARRPGLLAVTVVADDPARAEVWSKSLFLAGAGGHRRDGGAPGPRGPVGRRGRRDWPPPRR